MTYETEDDIMPLSPTSRFPEADRAQFLDSTIQQNYSKAEGKTLLVVCEGGDTGHDEKKLKKNKTTLIHVDSLEQLTPQYLSELEVIYQPERMLMEWDSMWSQDELKPPADWTIYQQIAIIDGPTFKLYVQNTRPLLDAMLRSPELVIVDRCDDIPDEKLTTYRKTIRVMSRESEIMLKDKEDEIEQAMLEEDFPYDINSSVIRIKPEDYSIRYIDYMDQPEWYRDKVMELTAVVLKSPEFPKEQLVPGHIAMACYETDMTFLGFICKWKDAENFETKQRVRARARIGVEYQRDYHGEGPVLYAKSVEPMGEIRDVTQLQTVQRPVP